MSSNSADIVHQIHQDFKDLIEYVTGKESQTRTAYEVELTLFRRLLALGAQLLYLFFVQRAADCPPGPVSAPDGTRLTNQGKRRTSYFSIFGKVRFRRHYFHATGQEGICPLDAELSLPPHCYSDLLRDFAEYSTTTESYGESNRILKHILGLSISKQALETAVEEDALRDSLERFKTISERLVHITGATVDGWDPAQKALRGAFPGITLAECHLHAMLKLGQHLATFKRQRKAVGQPVSEQEEAQIRSAFMRVLQASTPAAYQKALDELPDVFDGGPLASRKDSLTTKQALFQAWTTDDKLTVVTTALDQCMKFLNRKQDNMQTFHGPRVDLPP